MSVTTVCSMMVPASSTNALVPHDRLVGHRQVTDAHLVSIARQHGVSLVTFDRGLRELAPDCTAVLAV